MSDMTPGQALYAVISERFIDEDDITDWSKWDELENSARDVYEDAAKAAITAGAAAETRPRVDWARVSEAVADRERERDEARERLAAIRKYCDAKIRMVGMVDGKGVARKVIAIIDKPEGQ